MGFTNSYRVKFTLHQGLNITVEDCAMFLLMTAEVTTAAPIAAIATIKESMFFLFILFIIVL